MIENTISNSVLFNKKQFTKKGSQCPLVGEDIDYKNISLLKQYISEKGRKMASRLSNTSAKNQRKLSVAIDRARNIALLPFTNI